jgi:tRNA1(Val) A37 N6-methylase TrmN6
VSDERFLGGRVLVRQSATGFRSGLDAVMLAAAVPAGRDDEALELGAGAGTASLCLAARAECRIAGVEIDPDLAELARENARANRVHAEFVSADVFDLPQELKRDFDHVFCNPPFHEGEPSADAARDRALRDAESRLGDWIAAGLKRTVSNGTFTLILRADRLGEALAHLPERGVAIFPLWPRQDQPAKRVILQARKGSRAAPVLLPGLVLHRADGAYTPQAQAVLRDGASLALDSRGL